ncbi:MAG: hypothetical protein E7575_07285 [Ruminococcaceae bacterium]|nr:hypothetical protein [Oscillospiraceae bacterium]
MKKLLLIFLALALCFSLIACGKDNAKKDDEKKEDKTEQTTASGDDGKEKETEPVETVPNAAEDNKKPRSVYDNLIVSYNQQKIPYSYEADSAGNETKRTYYDEKTKVEYAVFTYEYDKDGKLSGIKAVEYMVNCDIEYIFDKNEVLLIRTDKFDNGNKTVTEYNENCDPVKSEVYKKTAEGTEWYVNHYNDIGKIAKTVYLDKDGNETGYTEYEYDAKGNLVSEIDYDANGARVW